MNAKTLKEQLPKVVLSLAAAGLLLRGVGSLVHLLAAAALKRIESARAADKEER